MSLSFLKVGDTPELLPGSAQPTSPKTPRSDEHDEKMIIVSKASFSHGYVGKNRTCENAKWMRGYVQGRSILDFELQEL